MPFEAVARYGLIGIADALMQAYSLEASEGLEGIHRTSRI